MFGGKFIIANFLTDCKSPFGGIVFTNSEY